MRNSCKKFIAIFFGSFCFINPIQAQDSPHMEVKPLNVVMTTNKGKIKLELFPEVAPKACENFISLAKDHYYDGVIFHRVIKNFMIQGGDPTGTGRGGESKWGKQFEDECQKEKQFDAPWLLAMANKGPNTNGSQFFITTAATPWLNMRHTIFGKVVEGSDVVQKIELSKTDGSDRPVEEIKILSISIVP